MVYEFHRTRISQGRQSTPQYHLLELPQRNPFQGAPLGAIPRGKAGQAEITESKDFVTAEPR